MVRTFSLGRGATTPPDENDTTPDAPAPGTGSTTTRAAERAGDADEASGPASGTGEAGLPAAAPVDAGTEGDHPADVRPGEDGPRPAVRRAVLVGFALALVAAVVCGVWWNGGRAAEADRAAALEKAQAAAVELTSINYETAEQDVRRVLDGATGDFGGLFAQNLDSYISLVKESKVATQGEVTGAGLENIDGDTARAIVAVKATVHNQSVPAGESRFYRMVTELQKKNGEWLVARVEFVP